MALVSVLSPLYTTRLINDLSSHWGELISDLAKRVASKETEGKERSVKPRKKINMPLS